MGNCGLLTAAVAVPGVALGQAGPRRKRIAFLGTEVRTHSHAQHFLDRLALGYGWRGQWQEPRLDIASVFLDLRFEKHFAYSQPAVFYVANAAAAPTLRKN